MYCLVRYLLLKKECYSQVQKFIKQIISNQIKILLPLVLLIMMKPMRATEKVRNLWINVASQKNKKGQAWFSCKPNDINEQNISCSEILIGVLFF